MRFVVYGAGAIGGVVGARLHQHGHDVTAIARGDHLEAVAAHGLQIHDPTGSQRVPLDVVGHPAAIDWRGDEVVLLCVKSQHTASVLHDLAAVAPDDVPVVCLQNGVNNEREALRRFPHVYGVMVALMAAHLQPGVVTAYYSPVTGVLDIGRYPDGVDETARSIAAAFEESTLASQARTDIMRWKWRKLIMNLSNAIGAATGRQFGTGLWERAAAEADACLAAAGIDAVPAAEDKARRDSVLTLGEVPGAPHPGSSSWQSLARHSPDIETDHLNGEIVLLGRLHGVPTPVNTTLQRLANELVASGGEPGSVPLEELERRIAAEERANT